MTRSLVIVALLALAACASRSDPVASLVVEERSPAVGTDGKLAQSVGIETLGGVFTPLLQSGCPLPCSTTQTLSSAEDEQAHVEIRIFRGDCRLVSSCHSLGTVRISGFAAKPRGEPNISVLLLADPAGIRLSASEAGSQSALSVTRIAP